jgi:hypothetical protein
MPEGGSTQRTEVFAKYVMVIIVYIFCFYNLFYNKDDPYGLYLVMISLLIITTLFGIFLIMDVEKYGLYSFMKTSTIMGVTSLVVTSSFILNFVSIALFVAVFDSSRKYVKDRDNKIASTKPYMIQKMSNANENTFSIFKNKLLISIILIFCILGYFVFIINNESLNKANESLNKVFAFTDQFLGNAFVIINGIALFTIEGILLYNSIVEITYSSNFLKNKKRNTDLYPGQP